MFDGASFTRHRQGQKYKKTGAARTMVYIVGSGCPNDEIMLPPELLYRRTEPVLNLGSLTVDGFTLKFSVTNVYR
jgi:hypothetical protein